MLSSVNNRYLETSLRVPEHLLNRKWDIEKFLKSRISRGKVTLTARLAFSQKYLKENLSINGDLIRSYFSQIESLELPLNIAIGDLMKLPYAVESLDKEMDDESWDMFLEQLERLMEQFLASADKEGERLKRDIQNRMALIRREIAAAGKLPSKSVDAYRELLIKRIEKLKMEDFVDEARLYKEISYFAENQDFTEEMVRLDSHCEAFDDILDDERTEKGKRLSFLLQEMNREINTVGSKCKDSEIARHVITVKEELEKIREQIQNVW